MGWLLRFFIFAIIIYLLRSALKPFLLKMKAEAQWPNGSNHQNHSKAKDPYEILGVSRNASSEEIKKAYKSRIVEYHPDKVNHLGKELQDLANQKFQEISWAYDQLSS